VLDLILLPEQYGICRLPPDSSLPNGLSAGSGGVVSVTWTPDEVSVFCPAHQVPPEATVEIPWRCFRVVGPVNLALTGILASLVSPLARARVNIFAFSTFDTDYVLVPAVRLAEAVSALASAGHRIID
jgi:hypothetical protein